MSFLAWLMFGVLIAIVAQLLDSERSLANFLQTLILSTLGAVLGGTLANLVFNASLDHLSFPGLTATFLGSASLIIIPKFFSRRA